MPTAKIEWAKMLRTKGELYEALLRPAEGLMAESERVLLSPDGPLHTLPFGVPKPAPRQHSTSRNPAV